MAMCRVENSLSKKNMEITNITHQVNERQQFGKNIFSDESKLNIFGFAGKWCEGNGTWRRMHMKFTTDRGIQRWDRASFGFHECFGVVNLVTIYKHYG